MAYKELKHREADSKISFFVYFFNSALKVKTNPAEENPDALTAQSNSGMQLLYWFTRCFIYADDDAIKKLIHRTAVMEG